MPGEIAQKTRPRIFSDQREERGKDRRVGLLLVLEHYRGSRIQPRGLAKGPGA